MFLQNKICSKFTGELHAEVLFQESCVETFLKSHFDMATSKTWTRALDPGPGPWTPNPDPEKPGP